MKRAAPYLAIAALALLTHAVCVGNGFVFDDSHVTTDNAVVNGPFSLVRILRTDYWGNAAGEAGVGTWRPLPTLTFFLDWHLGHGAPWPFHLGNLLVHVAAVLLLAWALRPGLGGRAFVAAGLFGVLAIGSEGVSSIVARADVMAAALLFAAWGLAQRDRLIGAGACFFAALLCKESAIVFPLLLYVIDRVSGVPRLRRYLVLAAVAAVYLGTRALLYAPTSAVAMSINNNPLLGAPPWIRFWTAMRLLVLSLRVTLFPFNLSADYSFSEIMPATQLWSAEPIVGTLLFIAALGVLVRARNSPAALGLALFFIPWLTVSNLVLTLPTIFAERLLYLPSAGAAVSIVAGVAYLQRHRSRRAEAATLAPIFAFQMAFAVRADRVWHDQISLFANAVEVTPRSARAWLNYAAALAEAGRLDEAAAAFQQSIAIAPRWSRPHTGLGALLDRLNRPAAAYAELQRAMQLNDVEDARPVHNLAVFLARHGRSAEAVELLESHLTRHPKAPPAMRSMLDAFRKGASRSPRPGGGGP